MAKGKVKKIVTFLGIGLLVVIIAVALLFQLVGDRAIKAGIEVGAKKALQVDVRLENISVSLLRGKVELTNFEIDNPEGYKHPTFMKLGHAYLALDTGSLFSDTIVMKKIQLDNISVVIEQKGMTSNLNEILNNLPKSEETTEPEAKPEGEEKAGKNFRIDVLEINGVEVKAKLLPIPGRADTVTLKLKPIRLENIGSEEKVDASELTAKIIKAIAGGIADQGKDLLPTDMIGSVADDLAKQGDKLLETGKDLGKEATGILKGLNPFQKKEEATETTDEE